MGRVSAAKVRYLFLLAVLFILITTRLHAQSSVKPQKLIVLELKGKPYERGFQHGRQLKNEIGAVYTKWKANIKNSTGRDPDSVLTAFRKSVNFEQITRKYYSEILKEIKGIADGSGQSPEDVYAFQLIDEFWVYLDKIYHTGYHHCSSIGVAATKVHPAYIAQNIDLENYMQGFQVLLHLEANDSEPEQYIVSCAGLVALAGMNDKGTAVCLNSLMELEAAVDGMPVAFIIRAVLSKGNGQEALEFLKTIKHASGQNYILGIKDSVYDFEASANKVVRFMPGKIVYHTNHALANHDVKAWYKDYHAQVMAGQTANRNSELRLAALAQRIGKTSIEISSSAIKETLRSKDNPGSPVCRTWSPGRGGFTFSSVIFTLGGIPSVQVTCGSPDQAEYEEYFFASTHQ